LDKPKFEIASSRQIMPITPRRMPEMNEAVRTTSASDVETQDRGGGRDRKRKSRQVDARNCRHSGAMQSVSFWTQNHVD
jgi:hypothetical protein